MHAPSVRNYFQRDWPISRPIAPHGCTFRTDLRLRSGIRSLRLTLLALRCAALTIVNTVRIEHTIHGRSYVIEVRPVGVDRWRAQISRAPGGMTSLMPFYGQTPAEAADHLAGWLNRAGGRQKAV